MALVYPLEAGRPLRLCERTCEGDDESCILLAIGVSCRLAVLDLWLPLLRFLFRENAGHDPVHMVLQLARQDHGAVDSVFTLSSSMPPKKNNHDRQASTRHRATSLQNKKLMHGMVAW